jgi:hypothetical protein
MKEKLLEGILTITDSNEWKYRRCCFEYTEGLTFYWLFGVKLPIRNQIKGKQAYYEATRNSENKSE